MRQTSSSYQTNGDQHHQQKHQYRHGQSDVEGDLTAPNHALPLRPALLGGRLHPHARTAPAHAVVGLVVETEAVVTALAGGRGTTRPLTGPLAILERKKNILILQKCVSRTSKQAYLTVAYP